MTQTENSIDILNDLVRINNDRIEGYQKASKELKDEDSDLRDIFMRMTEQSRMYVNELHDEIRKFNGKPAEGATMPGKIYRVWMDLKATFTGNDRHAILSSCEYGEDAAQRAYDAALAEEDLQPSVRQLISSQKTALRQSHDQIKTYRDTNQ